MLRHLTLYGVLELPGRKNAKRHVLNSNYSKMPEYFSEDFLLVKKSLIIYMFTPKRLLKELV